MPKSEFKMPKAEDFPDVVEANRKMHDLHVQRADIEQRLHSAELRVESMRFDVDAAADRLLAGGTIPAAVDHARERETQARLHGELRVVNRAIAMQKGAVDAAMREAARPRAIVSARGTTESPARSPRPFVRLSWPTRSSAACTGGLRRKASRRATCPVHWRRGLARSLTIRNR